MRAFSVAPGGVAISDWLAEHTDQRPKKSSPFMSANGGVTITVEQDVMLRVDEKSNNTWLVKSGQEVHFFQDPDNQSVYPRTVVLTVFEGQVSVATYRKDIGFTERHPDRR